jgi:hypothetical protein
VRAPKGTIPWICCAQLPSALAFFDEEKRDASREPFARRLVWSRFPTIVAASSGLETIGDHCSKPRTKHRDKLSYMMKGEMP